MPMSPRTLRPVQNVHPEAAAWATRVVANGGTVGTSLPAVSAFCKAISATSGLRAKLYRVNLFCGASDASLVAVRTPLYRGPAATGTQYGGTLDDNVNFVQGDYSERGSAGGLKGNGSTKYLDTGLAGTTFSVGDRHMSAYWNANATLTGNRAFIGNSNTTGDEAWFDIHSRFSSAGGESQITDSYALTHTAANHQQLAQYVGDTSAESYSMGADKKTKTSGWTLGNPTAASSNFFIFSINPSLFSGVRTDARICCYSIGLSMTEAQALALYNAQHAFNVALGRGAS